MSLHQVSETIRVEDGYARKRAIATEEFLDTIAVQYKLHMVGSDNKPIEMGNEFEYLDRRNRVWNVYELQNVGTEEDPDMRYIKVAERETEQEALDHANTLV